MTFIARDQNKIDAADFAVSTLSAHGTVTLKQLAQHSGCSKTSLIELMRGLQEQGLALLTDAQGIYTAGPRLRFPPCEDAALQHALLAAITDRSHNAGHWTDVLLAAHLDRPREAVVRSLVTLARDRQIVDSYIGQLMIVRCDNSCVA